MIQSSHYRLRTFILHTTSPRISHQCTLNLRTFYEQLSPNHITDAEKTDNWGEKAKRRKTTGTGRMRSLKEIPRKFKNAFQLGTPKGAKGPANQAA
ncbi:MAG: hypothetical protein M1819_006349 [Sarea resinae]|nr:MAG: hypothetical protein M1819_006349 [Sarea resinae]